MCLEVPSLGFPIFFSLKIPQHFPHFSSISAISSDFFPHAPKHKLLLQIRLSNKAKTVW